MSPDVLYSASQNCQNNKDYFNRRENQQLFAGKRKRKFIKGQQIYQNELLTQTKINIKQQNKQNIKENNKNSHSSSKTKVTEKISNQKSVHMLERTKKSISLFQTPSKNVRSKEDRQLWLPDNLSGKILDLEFQCQTEKLSKQLIDRLVEYYSKAVEFYNERGNYKYKIYQKRMQMFLSKPKIEQILKGRSAKIIMAQEQTQEQIKNAEHNSKKTVEQIIEQHEKTSLAVYKKVTQDLKKQEQLLEERRRKKRTMSNKSTKTAENQDDEFGRGSFGQKMDIKMLLDGISQRNRKVFF